MQVEIEHAPAQRVDEQTVYFCSDHCDAGSPIDHDHTDATDELDPVCGMAVGPITSQHTLEHNGVTIYFCGSGCRSAFAADPDAQPRASAETTGGARR